jgi:hypothetical protein
MSSGSSILIRDVAPGTHTEQVRDPQLLARSAELRDDAIQVSSDVVQLHGDVQQMELDALTRAFEQATPTQLLERLSDDFAFSWAVLARVARVSPTAVRKWRRGETISPVFHLRLAELAAFCEMLRRLAPTVEDLSYWLEMPVVGRSDISRLDLFLAGQPTELLDLATGRQSGEALLDQAAPGWRERAAGDRSSVMWHDDGTASIVVTEG